MSKVLYIQASPRGERSYAIRAADAFIGACREADKGLSVTTINLFDKDLPPFDGFSLDAKYAVLYGEEQSEAEAMAWKGVETVIGEFTAAEKYVFAVPMWNFSIPYRLKHYFDVIVQPGYTFEHSGQDGYNGLVTGKSAFIAYARGNRYPPKGKMAEYDLQTRYLELILGFIGITDIHKVIVESTVSDPEAAEKSLAAAIDKIKKMAKTF